MTPALEGGEWSAARPGRTLPPGKTRYPFYRRLGPYYDTEVKSNDVGETQSPYIGNYKRMGNFGRKMGLGLNRERKLSIIGGGASIETRRRNRDVKVGTGSGRSVCVCVVLWTERLIIGAYETRLFVDRPSDHMVRSLGDWLQKNSCCLFF